MTHLLHSSQINLSPIDFRMHRVPLRGLLECQRDAQRRRFIVQAAGEHDRAWQAWRARETAGDANGWMARQISDDQACAAGRGRNKNVPLRHQLIHLAH